VVVKDKLLQNLKKQTLDIVSRSEEKYTHGRLLAELIRTSGVKKAEAGKVLKALVEEGALAYTYLFGCSFLEKSIHKATLISDRVVLVPLGVRSKEFSGKISVVLGHGASFGTGRHPTTRLSIQALDLLLGQKKFFSTASKGAVLDIGTGSGVLAIAAVKLGMSRAVGLDIESISRKEAMENVEHNGLSSKIQISDKELSAITNVFSLIVANLRLPTLKQLFSRICKTLKPGGGIVLSGIKDEELLSLRELYEGARFQCVWQKVENGWACLAFIKTI
jgi:ribosomal protein L11 methyltransferase